MKNYIGLKNPLRWQNCEALFFQKINWLVFFALQHIALLSHNKFGWIENWEFCNIYSSEHAIFLCCIKFFFWSFFKTFWTCIVPCTLHISEQMLGNINWPKKTCDIIIHLVPRLTFRHIGDFHDTHMRSLPGNCN